MTKRAKCIYYTSTQNKIWCLIQRLGHLFLYVFHWNLIAVQMVHYVTFFYRWKIARFSSIFRVIYGLIFNMQAEVIKRESKSTVICKFIKLIWQIKKPKNRAISVDLKNRAFWILLRFQIKIQNTYEYHDLISRWKNLCVLASTELNLNSIVYFL